MQTRTSIDRRPETIMQRESFGELLSELANNSAALVRDELDLAKQEMSEKVNRFRSGAVVAATGAIIACIGVMALVAAAILGLANYVEPWLSALIIGAALAIIGGAVALIGIGQIKRMSLKPEQTIETLQEDKEWLKELT